MSTDTEIENEIIAKGKTAPRVTPKHIEDCIVAEFIGTANALFKDCPITPEMKLLTICVLELRNGFTVTGESACSSPENFDREIGQKIARQNAKDKIWMLEGYALNERLNLSAYPERQAMELTAADQEQPA